MWPQLESIHCFDVGARLLNFRAAAKQVFLSPAAFSDRIRRLEEQLGAPLFVRSTRKVVLTETGERLLPQARRMLEDARSLTRPVAQGPMPYELTLGTRYELGLSWVLPALSQLEKQQPHRTLHLHFADSAELISSLKRGTIDCAVSSTRLLDPSLRYVLLHEEQYQFVAAPKLLKSKALNSPAQASAHTLLDISHELPLFHYFLDARPRDEKWSFTRVHHLGTISAVRQRALEGAGVAVLPKYFIREALRDGSLKPLLRTTQTLSDYFRLLWHKDHPRQPALEQLGNALQQLPIR